ncbi:MAG TPA: FAD-dependent oxidoreductase [Phycisphaerales bacterium]|nr:FAD-dependent oxidoreductase [Phycisphaerales bacterium]
MSASAGDIAVIGSGVAGLTAAIELATRLSGRPGRAINSPRITVYADRVSAPPASFIAPALFTPYAGPDEERFRRWTERSFATLARIAAEDPSSGVRMAELREYFYKRPVRRAWLDELLATRPLQYPPSPPLVEATTSVRPHIDMLRYMPWLESRAAAMGVRFEQRSFVAIDEVFALGYSAAVNCAGVGAGRLADDPLVKPMHGQVLHLRNDIGLTYSLHDDAGGPEGQVAYIFVFEDRLVLGGTFDAGRDDHATDRPALDALLERCRNLLRMDGFPRWAELGRGRAGTGGREELRALAGVRPTRGPGGVGRAGAYEHTRVERESVAGGVVVHCYGHGRSGATLSWGSAAEVADLLLGKGS